MDKWNRSLNPVYSTQPFTKVEDRKLLLAVKETNIKSRDWKVVSRMFPLRNPRTLLSRYLDLTNSKNSQVLNDQEEADTENGMVVEIDE